MGLSQGVFGIIWLRKCRMQSDVAKWNSIFRKRLTRLSCFSKCFKLMIFKVIQMWFGKFLLIFHLNWLRVAVWKTFSYFEKIESIKKIGGISKFFSIHNWTVKFLLILNMIFEEILMKFRHIIYLISASIQWNFMTQFLLCSIGIYGVSTNNW